MVKSRFEKVIELSEYARREINAIGGYYAYSKELIDGVSVCDFDVTKLSVYTQGIGLTGIEVYDLLRDEYDIQIEFGDIGNILAYISIGDRIQDIERLVGALADIKRLYSRDGKDLIAGEYIQPELVLSPQEVLLFREKKFVFRRICWTSLWGICHVLSSRNPYFGSWRTHYTRNCRLYPICQGTWLLPPRDGRS